MSKAKNKVTHVKIDFAELGGPTYIGRPNGEAARKKLNLDERDTQEGLIFDIYIPANTYNINSSYFLGLFGKSITQCGSDTEFYKKFIFHTNGKTYPVIERGIARALVKEKSLGINND